MQHPTPRPPWLQFVVDGIEEVIHGSLKYHLWMGTLTFLMLLGTWAYSVQMSEGMIVTGMHDHVSWGFYISNFTFLVGVAAAAVILVMPTYVLKDYDFKRAVLIGEAMAVAALIMAIWFVIVDVGGPARLWHMMPGLGQFNWPASLLCWDMIVLNVYLGLNFSIPFYLLYCRYTNQTPNKRIYIPLVLLSILWAVSLHLVTAFLYSGLPARPFWHTALMGPRFLATAFTAGPALMILVLSVIRRNTEFEIRDVTLEKLSLVVTVAAQICMVMLVSELFTEFYRHTHHGASARYLYFGLDGKSKLVPFIWSAIAMNVVATVILTIHRFRKNHFWLDVGCVLLFIGILIEKGVGTIIPGFIPEPWGKIDEYAPTWVELLVSLGIWAIGAFVFTVLAKVAIPIELGKRRYSEVTQ
jgi:Ni/Fe-hydrogenase subunit HybB-like protein